MNFVDILLAVIVGGSVIAGFMSGFTRAAFGLIAAFAGVLLGFWFYKTPAAWYVGTLGSETVADLFGFLTVFLIVMVAGAILGRIISTAFKFVGLGPLDRLAGAGFGLVRGIFVAAAATAALIAATPRPVPEFMRSSALLPYALSASDFVTGLAPSGLKKAVSGSVTEIKKSWNEEVEKAKRRVEQRFDATPAVKDEPKAEPKPKAVEIIPPKPKSKTKAKAKLPKAAPPKAVQQ